MSDTLNCGHPPTPTEGPGTGYAETPEGETICYLCADERQRAELEALEPGGEFFAYLSERRDGSGWLNYSLTTWSGGHLADVRARDSRIAPGVDGLRFVSADGRYYGMSPGAGMYARVRRYKPTR